MNIVHQSAVDFFQCNVSDGYTRAFEYSDCRAPPFSGDC